MLHGYGLFLLFTPIGWIFIGLLLLLCMAAHAISRSCSEVTEEALVNRRFDYFVITLVSVAIALGLAVVMLLIFSIIPWIDAVFSEWGILYENAVPQAIIYYVLWGIAFYFAMFMQKRSILKRFKQEYTEIGRRYARNYFFLSAVFAFLLQFLTGVVRTLFEAFF